MIPQQVPFLLHALIELVASLVFITNPASQLPLAALPPPAALPARLVVQSLGGAVLSSSLVALAFAVRPVTAPAHWDRTCRLVGWAFAFWHVWPCYRAAVRILSGVERGTVQARALGGPPVHLATHILFVGGFVWSACR
jgi:hypothetical protein